MTDAERERFDEILERVVHGLPARVHHLIERVPLVVEDRPSGALWASLIDEGLDLGDDPTELCGLYTGAAITERSVEDPADAPPHVLLFREGVLAAAGGWGAPDADIAEEVLITILHEYGHDQGLDEDDLADLGYD